ncbi:MAG: type II toxin-antitoxin system RelE/ParE family toxin [Planctomycetes bacterium]|nr:type II toxin-antitoxin system RelE/ParE family toxin [Planctomycetota bacterium]
MSGFVLTPEAECDRDEIVIFIAKKNRTAAIHVLDTMQAAMRRVGESPGLGHRRDDLGDETLRVFAVRPYPYLIIYRPNTKPLQIIRLIHGARDVGALLHPPTGL